MTMRVTTCIRVSKAKMTRPQKVTLTARMNALLRFEVFMAGIVDQRLPLFLITVVLIGVFDFVAVRANLSGVIAGQRISTRYNAARVAKLRTNPTLAIWIAAGNRDDLCS